MESDDDYDSFSFHDNERSPSPSPKHRRLKRLKKSTVGAVQSATDESVPKRVAFAGLEALDSSDIRAFDDSSERASEGFDGDGYDDEDVKKLRSDFDDTIVTEDRKETKRSLHFEEGFDDDGKVKDLSSCYDGTSLNHDSKEKDEDLEIDNCFDDAATEKNLTSSVGDTIVRTDLKETKRALDFDDDNDDGDVNEIGVDRMVENEGEKEADEDAMNMSKGKKKRLKSSSGDSKEKTSHSSKRREEKERRAQLDQLHVESQRLLRETRGVSFKPVPLVQKPISSILERIRQRKLEVSKKFSQSNTNDSYEEDTEHDDLIDHSKSVATEVSNLSESVREEKVSNVVVVDPELDDVIDQPDICGEQKDNVNACSQKDLDVESTPALRAPVEDTQELFLDSQTRDGKESENDESSSSSQDEDMGPSLLTMKLKFDSAYPDDICDEEENDVENVEKHSFPKGDPVKAFVDDEAEEEDDSDNDRMVIGDDEEVEDEDDIEELNKMIATGYKERPIDLETRNELHQKWLEDNDAAVTDDLLRKLNVDSKLREASLLDDGEGEDDLEINDDDEEEEEEEREEEEEEIERRPISRINSKKAKEIIAQMFKDKDDDLFLSDEEETEKIFVRERMLNKDKEKSRLVSPIKDKDSGEVFGFVKKLNTVPEGRKKANATSFFDKLLTGGICNTSSKSSFLCRISNHTVPVSTKQGGSSGIRSFIFERDDSNSRSSISISEDMLDKIPSTEVQTKNVTVKYKSSQSQGRSSTQLVSESSSKSFFEILKRSSAQSTVHNRDHNIELSQSSFAAFKIPKKPIKIQGRV